MASAAILLGTASFFLWAKDRTQWRVFEYFPPLLWAYAAPLIFVTVGILPAGAPVYAQISDAALPCFVVLLLMSIDVREVLRVGKKAVVVMLIGSIGVIIGSALATALFKDQLPSNAWQLYGSLAGAWIGGTPNMMAIAGAMGLDASDMKLPLLADNLMYAVWLPILLAVKRRRANHSEQSANTDPLVSQPPATPAQIIHLITVVVVVATLSNHLGAWLPEFPPVLTHKTWSMLLMTTLAIGLSFTPLRQLPNASPVGTAAVYVFLASMGARSTLEGMWDAPVFLAGAALMIAVHGAACLIGARLLRQDLAVAAVASAANVGGAATAPIVATHHDRALVAPAIMMGLLGYAVGNYLAVVATEVCRWVGQS